MDGSRVTVLYTTPGATLAALKTARRMTWGRCEPVRLIVARLVPYPLSLSTPSVPLGFTEQQLRCVALQSAVDTRIELYLCRDRRDVFREYLEPGSLVVLGIERRSYWPASERGLVRWLRKHGHGVLLAAPDEEAGKKALCHNVLQFRMPNSSH